MDVSEESRRRAFRNVTELIDGEARFPAQVFRGNWNAFLFFPSDHLFLPDFATIAAGLLNAEGAETCCLVNFTRTNLLTYESAATLFLDAATAPHAYDLALRRGGAAEGWLYDMEWYGISSESGEWCIYCERNNEVAAVALNGPDAPAKYAEWLRQLDAKPIMSLLDDDFAPFPFGHLNDEWRQGLSKFYAMRDH